jgi:transitional endoplasmic reticulum ATPase
VSKADDRSEVFDCSLFDDPDREERKHYAQYWQEKLKGTQGVDFPDSLLDTVADSTEGFSYAYLKEAL